MIYVKVDNITRSQVEALRECFDLIRDGYVEKFSAVLETHWFIRLSHLRSGKGIIIRAYADRYTIQVDKKVVKEWHDA